MPLNSDEVNYLIYRYLVESGFDHSAFVFLSETALHDRCIGGQHVERGALIRFLHKGLQYQSLEYHVAKSDSGRKCSAPFNFLKEHICTKSPPVQKVRNNDDLDLPSAKRQKLHSHSSKNLQSSREGVQGNPNSSFESQSESGPLASLQSQQAQKPDSLLLSQMPSSPPHNSKTPSIQKPINSIAHASDAATAIPGTQVTILKAAGSSNKTKMFQCSWNPTDSLTIALSGEATVCIWKVSVDPLVYGPQLHVNLRHDNPSSREDIQNSVEVNSLQWAPTGALLATGTSEGSTWLWSRSGVRIFHARKHVGPVLSMEWNATGNLVATASVDCKVIVWDTTTFSARQQIEIYETPIVSLDWLDDENFAVSSIDPRVYAFKAGIKDPLFRFYHDADVNKVSWGPSNDTLMSCSDDSTLKFWHLGNETCLWTATGHESKVNTCQWSPTRGSNIAASAASDGTARIWDVLKKKCLYVLHHAYQDVCCLNFSPDGRLLVTCTEDGVVNVWSVESGRVVGTFDAKIQVFETKWNGTGRKLALTLSNSTVAVIDFPP